MNKYVEDLFLRLQERGYQGRIVSVQHVIELKDEIEGWFYEGFFDEEFYRLR